MSEEPAAGRAWYRRGLRFECTRCGNCCTGAPGTVMIDHDEIDALARRLGLSTEAFRNGYTRTLAGGGISLKEKRNYDCVFWDRRGGCTVYEDRPRQCRTWPFWRANVRSPEAWERTGRDCPGIGHGPRHSPRFIELQIADDGTSPRRSSALEPGGRSRGGFGRIGAALGIVALGIIALAVVALASIAATGASAPVLLQDGDAVGPLALEWQPMEELNRRLPAGVRIHRGIDAELPLHAWYAYIDEPHPDIVTRVLVSTEADDARQTVSSFARTSGACVVVNGGYFTMDRRPAGHVGLLVTDGVIREPATPSVRRQGVRYETARAALGFSEDDSLDVAWVTTRDGELFAWDAPPQHRPGAPASPLDYADAEFWKMRDAIGAGPVILMEGQVRITTNEEVFFGTSIPDVHPRTAAGITADGALILMVVDGRQPRSRGVSLEELALMMRDVGAVEALNLDGGGSSTLVVRNILINRPAGGILQREVMSALATFCGPGEPLPAP